MIRKMRTMGPKMDPKTIPAIAPPDNPILIYVSIYAEIVSADEQN